MTYDKIAHYIGKEQTTFICSQPADKLKDMKKALLYEKCTRKMLVKLTTGVNFINVKRTNFSYVYDILAAFLVTFWLCQKICTKNSYVKR
jgi:hypothetical protein